MTCWWCNFWGLVGQTRVEWSMACAILISKLLYIFVQAIYCVLGSAQDLVACWFFLFNLHCRYSLHKNKKQTSSVWCFLKWKSCGISSSYFMRVANNKLNGICICWLSYSNKDGNIFFWKKIQASYDERLKGIYNLYLTDRKYTSVGKYLYHYNIYINI